MKKIPTIYLSAQWYAVLVLLLAILVEFVASSGALIHIETTVNIDVMKSPQ